MSVSRGCAYSACIPNGDYKTEQTGKLSPFLIFYTPKSESLFDGAPHVPQDPQQEKQNNVVGEGNSLVEQGSKHEGPC